MVTRNAVRLAVLGAAAVLSWRIVHVDTVVYGDENQPRLRLAVDSGAAQAQAVLRENPAHVRALLLLAARIEEAGKAESAVELHRAAIGIAPVDPVALRSTASLELRRGELPAALAHLDLIARLYPQSREWIFPLAARLLAAGQRAPLEALASQSAWLGGFIEFACTQSMDPGLTAPLLIRRAAAGRAQRAESACVVDQLRRAGRWNEAYHVWLNLLPRERLMEVGHVFNGGFEHAPSGFGFDWILETPSPVFTTELADGRGVSGRRALRVTYSGKRITGPAIRQFLAVVPGRYEFSGRSRLDGLQSVRGVRWVLRCAGEGGARTAALGASERFLGSSDWERFSFRVDVPAGCAGQLLQLEPVGLDEGTTYVAGKAWFDDLRLARAR